MKEISKLKQRQLAIKTYREINSGKLKGVRLLYTKITFGSISAFVRRGIYA